MQDINMQDTNIYYFKSDFKVQYVPGVQRFYLFCFILVTAYNYQINLVSSLRNTCACQGTFIFSGVLSYRLY